MGILVFIWFGLRLPSKQPYCVVKSKRISFILSSSVDGVLNETLLTQGVPGVLGILGL